MSRRAEKSDGICYSVYICHVFGPVSSFLLPMTVQEAQAYFQAAKANEPGAFESLYSGLFTPLYRYIILSVRHRETAEDLTQNLFIKALSLSEKGAEIEFLPYLYQMARNSIIDYYRQKKDLLPDTPVEEAFRDRPSANPSPNDALEAADRLQELSVALATLDDREREIITLRFFSELSHRETASVTGLSEANVRQIQSRALKRLRSSHVQLFSV